MEDDDIVYYKAKSPSNEPPRSALSPDIVRNYNYAKKKEIRTKTFKVLVYPGAASIYIDYVDADGYVWCMPIQVNQNHNAFVSDFDHFYRNAKKKSEPSPPIEQEGTSFDAGDDIF